MSWLDGFAYTLSTGVSAVQSVVEEHRRDTCATYPQGDSTLDCLFNIADVLQTLLYIASSSQNFGDSNGPALMVCYCYLLLLIGARLSPRPNWTP